MQRRLSADLIAIGTILGVAEYEPSKDFKTNALQSLGVGYYQPGTSLRVAVGEDGELTKQPWCSVALVLEFHNRNQAHFRNLTMNISFLRFASTYKVRATVGWDWPLRVKYDTGYDLTFPFSASDTNVFEEHLSKMESIFLSTARRSLQRAR